MKWHTRVMDAWKNPALNWDLANRMDAHARRSVVSFMRQHTWQIFWTQTFRTRTSENGAQQRWLHFLAESNLLSTLQAHMWAVEPHANIPSHHVHALLSMKQPTTSNGSPKYFELFWSEWRGWKERAWREMGKALILKADEQAPIHYVLKYVLKKTATGGTARPTADSIDARPTPENLWGVWTADEAEDSIQA
jgi:hypothetical protein